MLLKPFLNFIIWSYLSTNQVTTMEPEFIYKINPSPFLLFNSALGFFRRSVFSLLSHVSGRKSGFRSTEGKSGECLFHFYRVC